MSDKYPADIREVSDVPPEGEGRSVKLRLFFSCVAAMPLVLLTEGLYAAHPGVVTAVLSPANRSVWELSKLCFWPFLLITLCSLFRVKPSADFLAAQMSALLAAQLLLLIALSAAGHYAGLYSDFFSTALCGMFLVVGLISGFFLRSSCATSGVLPIVGFLVAVLAVCYIIFTFQPPELPLFENPFTSVAGFYSL